MISFELAYSHVLNCQRDYGSESLPLEKTMGRILAEDILADRDFPPFDRATKDGIAIAFEGLAHGNKLKLQGVIAAGTPQGSLENTGSCLEIMTGAVMPLNADTVVMYEDIDIAQGVATIHKIPVKGADIHYRGSDVKKGVLVLSQNTRISSAEIGLLASVGKVEVWVKKLPQITLVSTGNELVDIDHIPLPHQIRKSNIYSLSAALSEEQIRPKQLHLPDDKKIIKASLSKAITENDVLLLSGGVSKGKYDFIPEVLTEIGVEKIFHGVLQQPGKPFWFGIHKKSDTLIFSFPGNPVSTFANYHLYFKNWLYASLKLAVYNATVLLGEEIQVSSSVTKFLRVKTRLEEGKLCAFRIPENGSGDLISLVSCDGFVHLSPGTVIYQKGDVVPFTPTRRIV